MILRYSRFAIRQASYSYYRGRKVKRNRIGCRSPKSDLVKDGPLSKIKKARNTVKSILLEGGIK
ncbi:MAG: hypothetical protein ACI4EJ_10580 [Bacteroides sp.]